MKKLLFSIAAGLCVISNVDAQENTGSVIGMKDEFASIAKSGRMQSGFENLQSYSNVNAKGSQFFYPTWLPGSVVTAGNETISGKYLFLFDRVRQELFIKLKDSNVVLLADKAQIQSFTLNLEGNHVFVPDTKYKKDASEINFYEIMELNEKGYSFFKFVSTKFEKANPNDMVKVRNGDLSDEFVDNTVYYLYNTGTGLNKISFSEKSILKSIDASKQSAAKAYFTKHDSDKIDENFVIGLVKNLNN